VHSLVQIAKWFGSDPDTTGKLAINQLHSIPLSDTIVTSSGST
jgi:hypothetical protein